MKFLFLISLSLVSIAHGEGGRARNADSGMYSPVGKRDPFKVPPLELLARSIATTTTSQKYSIEKMSLRAILRGGSRSEALFEDPEGKTFIVGEGDVIGRERGTISRILDTEVIVTERTFNYLGNEVLFERLVSLPKEELVPPGATGAGGREGQVSQEALFAAPTTREITKSEPAGANNPVTSFTSENIQVDTNSSNNIK